MKVHKLLLLLNVGTGLLFALWLAYVRFGLPWSGASSRITTLDRAGVIDEVQLRNSFPSLVENLRYELGRWIAEKERVAAFRSVCAGLVVAIANIVLLLVGGGRTRSTRVNKSVLCGPASPEGEAPISVGGEGGDACV